MKTCNKCNITIETNHDYCPLCHQTLSGENNPKLEEFYTPKEKIFEIKKKTRNIYLFIGIFSIFSLAILNTLTFKGNYWATIPIGAIIYLFIVLRYLILSRMNNTRRITITTLTLFLLLLLINLYSEPERLWAVDYILPSLIFATNLGVLLLSSISRKPFKEYTANLLLTISYTTIPLITYLSAWSSDLVMVIISLSIGALELLFLLIFHPKDVINVLKKIFHF